MNDGTPIIIKKKKVAGHGGHHGGSWKVAYADFVTAMMAFFMVMWIMGLSDDAKALIQGYFNDPLGFAKNEPKADPNILRWKSSVPKTIAAKPGNTVNTSSTGHNEEQELKDLQKKLEESIKSGGPELAKLLEDVQFAITPEGLRIELMEASGAVFFDTGRATIRDAARKLVARIAPLIVQSNRAIIIEGHTDSMPYPAGGNYDNWDLSTDRARSMRHLLMAMNVPANRFKGVTGYADTKLVKPEMPYHYANRRVTVLLPFQKLGETSIGLPKDQLKNDIQGVFRRPVEVAPNRPTLTVDEH